MLELSDCGILKLAYVFSRKNIQISWQFIAIYCLYWMDKDVVKNEFQSL